MASFGYKWRLIDSLDANHPLHFLTHTLFIRLTLTMWQNNEMWFSDACRHFTKEKFNKLLAQHFAGKSVYIANNFILIGLFVFFYISMTSRGLHRFHENKWTHFINLTHRESAEKLVWLLYENIYMFCHMFSSNCLFSYPSSLSLYFLSLSLSKKKKWILFYVQMWFILIYNVCFLFCVFV